MWRATKALVVGFLALAVPAVAIVESGEGTLNRYGLAAAIGALVWACVLEAATLPDRLARAVRAPVLDLTPTQLALPLLVVNVGLCAIGFSIGSETWAGAVLLSAAFTALVDIASFTIALVMCGEPSYPLGDPE